MGASSTSLRTCGRTCRPRPHTLAILRADFHITTGAVTCNRSARNVAPEDLKVRALSDHRAEGEDHVRRSLREAAHVPRVPRVAVCDEVANEIALGCEPALLVHADPVQHLDLEVRLRQAHRRGMLGDLLDQPDIVRAESEPHLAALPRPL